MRNQFSNRSLYFKWRNTFLFINLTASWRAEEVTRQNVKRFLCRQCLEFIDLLSILTLQKGNFDIVGKVFTICISFKYDSDGYFLILFLGIICILLGSHRFNIFHLAKSFLRINEYLSNPYWISKRIKSNKHKSVIEGFISQFFQWNCCNKTYLLLAYFLYRRYTFWP